MAEDKPIPDAEPGKDSAEPQFVSTFRIVDAAHRTIKPPTAMIGNRNLVDIIAEIEKWRVEVEEQRKEFEAWRREVEGWRKGRDVAVRGSEGGKKKPRRLWAPYAAPIMDALPPKTTSGVIILRMKNAWEKHPKWPPLPGERALRTWISERRKLEV
jgi:hypothetical protein